MDIFSIQGLWTTTPEEDDLGEGEGEGEEEIPDPETLPGYAEGRRRLRSVSNPRFGRPVRFGRRPKLGLERPRVLEAPSGEPAAAGSPPNQTDVRNEVFAALEAAHAKAETLMSEIRKALVTLSVPVRPEDVEVRAAVARQDPPSAGVFITFDLYLKALAFEWESFDVSPEDLTGLLSGQRTVDAKHLQELTLSKATKLSKDDCRLMQSQVMYLYILQLMQMGLQALECEKQTATKITPPGSEVPPLTISTIFSLAFQLAYSENLLSDLKQVLTESAKSATRPSAVNIDAAISAAKEFKLPDLKALNLALRSKEPQDLVLIRDYARAFVKQTKKVGYEPWLLADEVFVLRGNLQKSLRQKPRYFQDGRPFSDDVARLFRYRAQGYSQGLDQIATALTETDTYEVSVCSLHWLVRLAELPILFLRSVLEFLLQARALLLDTALLPEITIDASILETIIHDLIEMVLRVGGRLLCWFQRDPEIWAILETCPPIAEMVNAALCGIEELEGRLFSMLATLVRSDRSILFSIEVKSRITLEMKKVRMMLSKLDYVVQVAALNRDLFTDLKLRLNLDKEIFGAATQIGIKMKEKFENAGDFVRVGFESEFLNNLNAPALAAATPGISELTVPFVCAPALHGERSLAETTGIQDFLGLFQLRNRGAS